MDDQENEDGSEASEEVEDGENDMEVFLGKCSSLLADACVPGKGQKKLIKQLYANSEQVLDECSPAELLKAIKEPTFIASAEGRKLAVTFAPKVGFKKLFEVIYCAVGIPSAGGVLYQQYGEVMFLAWKKNEEGERDEVIEVFSKIVYYALCTEPEVAKNFAEILEPLRKARCKQIDPMIFKIMLPNLWRCLKARCTLARLNAIKLLGAFYPIMTDDDFTSADFEGRQREALLELLMDDSYAVRIEAIKSALSILGSYWVTFDSNFIRQILKKIDLLSKDSLSVVRVAVYESLCFLLPCSQAMNAFEIVLKNLIPRGINDFTHKVRLAAFQLLTALRGHRFIHFWDVIEMEKILDCFEVEDSDLVRKQITMLLLPSFKPTGMHPDEGISRVLYLGEKTRTGVISLHHIMVAAKLVTVEEALEHAQMLAVTIYKVLRPSDNIDASSATVADENLTQISAKTSGTSIVINPKEDDNSEGAKQWRNCRLLLDCLVATWVPLRKQLIETNCEIEGTRTMNILSKLFTLLFNSFKNSSMLESIMALGSALTVQRSLSAVVMRDLVSETLGEEGDMHLYLEVAANWDIVQVLDFVHKGLQRIGSDSKTAEKRRKKNKSGPACTISRALQYLKLMLTCPTIEENLMANCAFYIRMFHTDLMQINSVVESMLDSSSVKSFENHCKRMSLNDIIQAYGLQHVLSIIILNTADDPETSVRMRQLIEQSATCLLEKILPKLITATDFKEKDFLVQFSQMALQMFMYHLQTYTHALSYKKILAEILNMLIIKDAATNLIIPVLNVLKHLLSAVVEDEELMEETVAPLTHLCLAWIGDHVTDDDFDSKQCVQSFISMLGELQANGRLKEREVDECAKLIIATCMPVLVLMNKEQRDVVDPRAYSFVAPPVVKLLQQEIVVKCPDIQAAEKKALISMFDSKELFERRTPEDIVYFYGAMMQLLLLNETNPKQPTGDMAKFLKTISKQMEQLDEQIKESDIYGQLMEMCKL